MIHGFSIDVEDWYQSTFDPEAPLTERFERSTDKILACLAETHTKGTFFILGMAAEKRPSLVKKIAGEGHEIQSHGYGHRSNLELDAETLRQDLARAKALLEEVHVATVPGLAFGACGEGYLRLSYATDIQLIAEAFERMKTFFRRYHR